MCGIAGFLAARAGLPDSELACIAARMADCLVHRGPDAHGAWSDPHAGVALGHRRLSIVDLSELGAQPMCSADGRFVLVYNGEIYNFGELREQLAARGHSFRGTSDTEVMLAAFVEWGVVESLPRLSGMFAVAVWDRRTSTLTLARDRLGEKPLYYGWVNGAVVFGSELKALRRHPWWCGEVDRGALALYFRTNYVPGPYSIYRGIHKLEPGSSVSYSAHSLSQGVNPEPVRYWSLTDVVRHGLEHPFTGTEREATDRLEEILGDVVRSQMIADVPLGALLSGGIDSSTVVALMQKHSDRPVKTFTLRFDVASFNESDHAKAVAAHLHTEHTELRVTAEDSLDVIPRLPEWYDEPFADSSQIPTALVTRLARQQVTVCLTGDGGDEVFCGYNRHVQLQRLWRRLSVFPPVVRRQAASIIRGFPVRSYDWFLRRQQWGFIGDQVQKIPAILESRNVEDAYVALTAFWPDPAALVLADRLPANLLTDRSSWPELPRVMDRLLFVETMTSLPDDMLVKVDRAAMASSLEVRVPLLDHRVVEFAWSLPLEFKVRGRRGKRVLRQVLYRHVPPALVDRPKQGFGVPLSDWLRGPLRQWAEELLDESRLRAAGFLDAAMVRSCWREHLTGRRNWHGRLWGVLMFQSWLEREGRALDRAA